MSRGSHASDIAALSDHPKMPLKRTDRTRYLAPSYPIPKWTAHELLDFLECVRQTGRANW